MSPPVAQALQGMELTAMCDIDNPLYGDRGGRRVCSGPRRAPTRPWWRRLDAGLRHLWQVSARRAWAVDFSHLPGAGAAGGHGRRHGGLLRRPSCSMGIDAVLDAVDFDRPISRRRTWCSPARGKSTPKAPGARWSPGWRPGAGRQRVPVVAVVGQIGQGFEEMYQQGLTAVFSINRAAQPFAESRFHAGENLALTMENIARLLAAGR